MKDLIAVIFMAACHAAMFGLLIAFVIRVERDVKRLRGDRDE
jgi:hypothetical protein